MRTIVLQRVVPHYRAPLFARLHDELGWVVATGQRASGDGLKIVDEDPPWLRRFDFHRDPAHQYRARVPMNAILEELTPDAIVAEFTPQMSSTWRLSRDAALLRRRDCKLVYWSQGPNVERGFRKLSDLAVQALRLALLAPAHAHLCYSDAGAAYLRRWLPGHRPVFVASNTVDLDAYPDRHVDTSPTDPATPRLLFVGRLTPDKRVPLLVEAVRLARASLPGLTLTIVGDGPDMAAVKAAAMGLGNAITLAGAVYNDSALAPYFHAASLFTYAGSIGLAANHALAYGVPVAIFDDPGAGARHHPEHAYVIDGVTGYRIRPATADAFARRLVALFSSGKTPKAVLGPSIRGFAEERLSIDKMLEGFRALNAFLQKGLPAR